MLRLSWQPSVKRVLHTTWIVKFLLRTDFKVMMNWVHRALKILTHSVLTNCIVLHCYPNNSVSQWFHPRITRYYAPASAGVCLHIHVSVKQSCWVNKWLSGSSWWAVMICVQCSLSPRGLHAHHPQQTHPNTTLKRELQPGGGQSLALNPSNPQHKTWAPIRVCVGVWERVFFQEAHSSTPWIYKYTSSCCSRSALRMCARVYGRQADWGSDNTSAG